MKYSIDQLSFWLGKFEQDCYLIARGVRLLGSHTLNSQKYEKIKNNITGIAIEHGVNLEIIKKDLVDIIVYHSDEGKIWLEKLKKLDQKIDAGVDNQALDVAFAKLINQQKLTKVENKLLKKLSIQSEKFEKKYGEIFGYSESSIRRHLEK